MNQSSKIDVLFKIILVGSSGVGKTCFLLQFTEGQFADNHKPTVGVDFKLKTFKLQNKVIKLSIWDTAGQERFGVLTQSHFKGAHGCICMYDITDEQSFQKAQYYMQLATKEHGIDGRCCILIGNKVDLEEQRAVIKEKGEKLAGLYSSEFMETSSKSNESVTAAFQALCEKLMQKIQQPATDNPQPSNQFNSSMENGQGKQNKNIVLETGNPNNQMNGGQNQSSNSQKRSCCGR